MNSQGKTTALSLLIISVVFGSVTCVAHHHRPQQVSTDVTWAVLDMDTLHVSTISLPHLEAMPEIQLDLESASPGSQQTIVDAPGCTKSVTSSSQHTSSGETDISKVSINCSARGQSTTTSVNGTNVTIQGGNVSSTSSSSIDINIGQ